MQRFWCIWMGVGLIAAPQVGAVDDGLPSCLTPAMRELVFSIDPNVVTDHQRLGAIAGAAPVGAREGMEHLAFVVRNFRAIENNPSVMCSPENVGRLRRAEQVITQVENGDPRTRAAIIGALAGNSARRNGRIADSFQRIAAETQGIGQRFTPFFAAPSREDRECSGEQVYQLCSENVNWNELGRQTVRRELPPGVGVIRIHRSFGRYLNADGSPSKTPTGQWAFEGTLATDNQNRARLPRLFCTIGAPTLALVRTALQSSAGVPTGARPAGAAVPVPSMPEAGGTGPQADGGAEDSDDSGDYQGAGFGGAPARGRRPVRAPAVVPAAQPTPLGGVSIPDWASVVPRMPTAWRTAWEDAQRRHPQVRACMNQHLVPALAALANGALPSAQTGGASPTPPSNPAGR